jgi:hypothetical protein
MKGYSRASLVNSPMLLINTSRAEDFRLNRILHAFKARVSRPLWENQGDISAAEPGLLRRRQLHAIKGTSLIHAMQTSGGQQ